MPFKMDNDMNMPTFFRVTIAATGFATGTATSAGGITPIGSRPSDATTGPYFYDTDGSGTKGVTGPTTDAKALERERIFNLVRAIPRDIKIRKIVMIT